MCGMRHLSVMSALLTIAFLSRAEEWRSPSQELLEVLYAPLPPWVWVSPGGDYLLLADPVVYPPLEEIAAPMHKLAGLRVNPLLNDAHGRSGAASPRLVMTEGGDVIPMELPPGARLHQVSFTASGDRFALTVGMADHVALWLGSRSGELNVVPGIRLNPLLGNAVNWLPDQSRLVALRVPERGPVPTPPAIPTGPRVAQGSGESARSTYEARDLLQTDYDETLFDWYLMSEPVVIDPATGETTVLGASAHYYSVEFSPDGQFVLALKLVPPWSREVAYWRFPSEAEVWTAQGDFVASIASLPLADQVPPHGVPLGPRSVQWRATAPCELYWVEALDGGDPVAEAPHRDRLMRLAHPFTAQAEEVFLAEHRIMTWQLLWAEDGGTLMLTQHERMRRRYHTWLVDVDEGSHRAWFDRDTGDHYGDPGSPVMRRLENGYQVLRARGDFVWFSGRGGTEEGDRPFLDMRSMETGETVRLFRSDKDRYENFMGFAGGEDRFIIRSESSKDPPDFYLAELGETIQAPEGEASRAHGRAQITRSEDPAPELREIQSSIVHYQREDGVPLSFHLYLPPGYREGTRVPTVINAYPLEYSDPSTAGQVRGSVNHFMRFYGASPLFFLLRGYAVLDRVAMPMIGDPETTYDTFVPQLVASAEAAVARAVEIGVADPERIGITGHSHGALMVANLLAHTDLFRAGIARSGSYNKTVQPFGFQAERRSLFDARHVYIEVSPLFHAHGINEPILIIHGEDDANPGTLPYQSEVLYEAVRGTGGTTRLVMLPHEDHGYRAKESVEHVLWEQIRWFDMYLSGD